MTKNEIETYLRKNSKHSFKLENKYTPQCFEVTFTDDIENATQEIDDLMDGIGFRCVGIEQTVDEHTDCVCEERHDYLQ